MTDRRADARRGWAVFAALSLALHAGLLALLQWPRERGAPPPEPMPIDLVALEPEPPGPAPTPEPEPDQAPPEPEPEIEPPEPEAAEPETVEPPAAQPEPDPLPEPEIAAPAEPAPAPEAPVTAAPGEDAEDEEESENGITIPGVRYSADGGGPLGRFLHAVDCANINNRYEDYCADVGPIYVAENPGRLAPEAEEEFRRMMEWRRSQGQVQPQMTGGCEAGAAGANLGIGCTGGDPGAAPRMRDYLD